MITSQESQQLSLDCAEAKNSEYAFKSILGTVAICAVAIDYRYNLLNDSLNGILYVASVGYTLRAAVTTLLNYRQLQQFQSSERPTDQNLLSATSELETLQPRESTQYRIPTYGLCE